MPTARALPDDISQLRAALSAEQLARREAEAGASGAEAMVAHLKRLIAKLRHERFGASSERCRKLPDQLELQPEKLETTAAEGETALDPSGKTNAEGEPARIAARRKPVRAIAGACAARAGGGSRADRLSVLQRQAGQARGTPPRRWK